MIGFTHPALALAVQIALGLLTGNWWIGVAVAASYFLGREIAQAEYRWIEVFGRHKRANMPVWGRFDPRVWDLHSVTDWLLPILVTVAVALVMA